MLSAAATTRLNGSVASLSELLAQLERSSFRQKLAAERGAAPPAPAASSMTPASTAAMADDTAPSSLALRGDTSVATRAKARAETQCRGTPNVPRDESQQISLPTIPTYAAPAPRTAPRPLSAAAAPTSSSAPSNEDDFEVEDVDEDEDEEEEEEDGFDEDAELPSQPTPAPAAFDRRRASIMCVFSRSIIQLNTSLI